jgi:hypothetical protein
MIEVIAEIAAIDTNEHHASIALIAEVVMFTKDLAKRFELKLAASMASNLGTSLERSSTKSA